MDKGDKSMKNRGLIFLDIVIGLFIIGLIVVVSFPILNLINKSFVSSKETTEMIYLAESTIETLKSKDERSIKFLSDLEASYESGPEALFLEDDSFISKVVLVEKDPKLWKLCIRVNKKANEGGNEYVEIKAKIPK